MKTKQFALMGIICLLMLRIPGLSAQSITVTSPNGGEVWAVGSTHEIIWSSSGISGNLRIEISDNNGTSWEDVVSDTPDDGSYLWNIPLINSIECIIRISEMDGDPSDNSDLPFTIESNLETDSLALAALYNATGGPSWTGVSNWLTGQLDTWTGVTVSGERVIYLILDSKNLVGSIPPEIGNLSNLTILSLGGNQLTTIPPEIENLSELTEFSLYSNQLTAIPPEIGNLSNLFALSLSNNLLTFLPPEIGDLTSLIYFEVRHNQLTVIPSETGNLSNLNGLDLAYNELTSLPPEIGDLANLIYLHLHYNQLSSLPPEIGNLSDLYGLYLEYNQLNSIPPEIGSLWNLFELKINNNQLTTIPTEIRNLSGLKYLDLSYNLLSSVPEEIEELNVSHLYLNNNQLISFPVEISYMEELKELHLENNQLTFEDIEPLIGIVNDLEYAPQDSVGESQQININDGDNYTIITSVGGSSNVYSWLKDEIILPDANEANLEIANATLPDSGLYRCVIQNTVATDLTLYSRPVKLLVDFEGIAVTSPGNGEVLIPESVHEIEWASNTPVSFVRIEFSDNLGISWSDITASTPNDGSFLWTVPTMISNLCLLRISDIDTDPSDVSNAPFTIGGNLEADSLALVALYYATDGPNWTGVSHWLTGNLNTWTGVTITEGRVTSLNLFSKNLVGPIPPEIGDLNNLTQLILTTNKINSIPPEIGNLTRLQLLYLYGNQLTVLPPEIGNLFNLEELIVSGNQLTGIPLGIGNLSNLVVLRMEQNQITGSIPPEIGNLSNLEHLELSNNDLSGPIPAEIGNLSNLIVLRLDRNQFTSIPPEFGNLSNLHTAWLHENQLTSIPPEMGNMSGLVWLTLSHNLITAIPPEFCNLPSVTNVDLNDNLITLLPPEIGNLTSLREMDLANNQLSSLPPEIGDLLNLNYLNVRYNQLTFEDIEPFYGLINLFSYVPQDSVGESQLIMLNDGDDYTFTASVGGTSNTYYWLKNGARYPDANSSDLEIYSVSPADSGDFYNCVIQNTLVTDLTLITHPMTLQVEYDGLALYSPDNGEILIQENFHEIKWASNTPISFVHLEFSDDQGISWSDIITSTQNDGSYLWTVPNVNSENCLIRIGDIGSDIADTINAPFTIAQGSLETDSLALVSLFYATGGSNWFNLSNWLGGPLDTWSGVYIYSDRVEQLYLDENNLVGYIPPEIGNLTNLQALALQDNQISSIPPEIGNLSNLLNLYLHNNMLVSVPGEVGDLTNLNNLCLENNQLTNIPPEIGNLSNLEQLTLDNNQLTSLPPEIGDLLNLQYLNICNNQITSLPPDIGNLFSLLYFYSYNNLITSLPPETGNLSNLQYLYLYNNQITSIPPEIGNLSKLIYLRIENNNLAGSIPPEIGNLSKLTDLNLENNQLTGSLPPEIGNLIKLQELNLSNNQLTGSIPPEIGNLSLLGWLDLHNNQLAGTVPPEFGEISYLQRLYLNNNQLTGSLPTEIADLSNLRELYLENNHLTYVPSEIINMIDNYLDTIDLRYNQLSFDSFEPVYDQLSSGIINYIPQDSIGESVDTTIIEGFDYEFRTDAGGKFNAYQWYKNGSLIPGEVINSLEINNTGMDDAGVYHCEINNPLVLDLTLYTSPITVGYESFAILSPNGGETLDASSTCLVTWNSSVADNFLNLEYSTDAGNTWLPAFTVPNTGSCVWTLPDVHSDNCMVRMEDMDGHPSDSSDGLFSIHQEAGTADLNIISPGDGAILIIGEAAIIQWETTGLIEYVNIKYSVNNGVTWSNMVTNLANYNIYFWTVPNKPSTECLIRISDTDGDPVDVSDAPFTISSGAGPTHFVTVWTGYGDDHMNFYALTATIDGIDMEPGDEIGIFDGEYCVGAGTLTEVLDVTHYLSMVASRDDDETPETDGYTPGNEITYKLWDASENVEIDTGFVDITYETGTGIFEVGSSTSFHMAGYTAIAQSIPLTSGWNIFSLAVSPQNTDMQNIVQPLIDAGSLIKVQDETGNAIEDVIPVGWVNNIGDWSFTEGYKIRVNMHTDLDLTGVPVSMPADIDLLTGWNIMGYPALASQDAEAAVVDLVSLGYLIKVQDEAGNAIEDVFPIGWVDNIHDFDPGEGYKIKVNTDCILTINEPSGGMKSTTLRAIEMPVPTHFRTSWSGNGLDHMNIYITRATLDEMPLKPGDEVAVFDGDQCVGATIVTGFENYITIAASKDDPETPEQDGFAPGNRFLLKIWDASSDREAGKIKSWIMPGFGDALVPMGTTVIELKGSLTESGYMVEPVTGLGRVYPNPFRDEINIEFSLSEESHVLIEVYNSLGELVEVLDNRNYPAGHFSKRSITGEDYFPGVYILKMTTGKFNDLRPIVLIK